MVLQEQGTGWDASADKIGSALQTAFGQRGMSLELQGRDRMTVSSQTVSPNTMMAEINAYRRGFAQLDLLGIRKDDGLLKALQLKRGALGRHARAVRDPDQALRFDRTPIGVFRQPAAAGSRELIPFAQLDLPAMARAASEKLNWGPRDWVVFHLMEDGGARVSEACTVTMAGWAWGDLGRSVQLRNKGCGSRPTKEVVLSEEGYLLLLKYFEQDRRPQDENGPAFDRWAKGRPYTPENYLEFLLARKIDPNTVQVFLNDRKEPLKSSSYRNHQWARLRRVLQLTVTPHHMRHRYVNQELTRIEREFWPEPESEEGKQRYRREIEQFTERMGWRVPESLLSYDHSGKLMKRMDWTSWNRRGKSSGAAPITGVAEGMGFTTAKASGLTGDRPDEDDEEQDRDEE